MNKYILNKCNNIINKREISEYEYNSVEKNVQYKYSKLK